ncbi:MAG: segregation/condensation protein A [Anaerolineaceae bacterium]|nr:segregation/condensation protein A [Anaerolineaceae bacterium]
MNLRIAENQTLGYRVQTSVYQGPLDLLLQLIEKAELDITTLALAQVTDQYIEYMHNMKEQNPSEVSAFLVIAARLLQIKSSVLLPKPPSIEQTAEEDPGEALIRQLILYRKFKKSAEFLKDREARGLRSFLRISPPQFYIEPKLDMSNISINDLKDAAVQIFLGEKALVSFDEVVRMPRISIKQRIAHIFKSLEKKPKTSFRSLLNNRDRDEVVVTFLALLELIKRHIINAHQETLFEDIELFPTEDWDPEEEFEIEFKG